MMYALNNSHSLAGFFVMALLKIYKDSLAIRFIFRLPIGL